MREPAETVYVVDDDPSVRRGLERLLRAAGYRVEVFASGGEFLLCDPNALRGCVLLDVRMPQLTGLELRDALAAAGCEMPIIFITGHGDIPMAVHAMKAGAVDFLTKPFEDTALLDAVEQALARDRARRGENHPVQSPGLGRRSASGRNEHKRDEEDWRDREKP